jgi:hypothetical protein
MATGPLFCFWWWHYRVVVRYECGGRWIREMKKKYEEENRVECEMMWPKRR